MKATHRHTGIDTLRGIGLTVVVLAHAGFYGYCRGWFVFAIPLFYMVAGYFYKDAPTYRELVANKFRRLIVPFIFFALCGLLIYIAGNCLLLRQPFNHDLFNLLSPDRYYLPYPASLWFFTSIFWCYIMFAAARKVTREEWQLALLCLIVGAAGWSLSVLAPIPLDIDTAMSWLPMFYIGYSFGRNKFGARLMEGRYWLAGAIAAVACCVAYVELGYNCGYCYNLFVGNIPAILALTTIATIGVTGLCCKIGYLPFFTFIGRHSLVIFAGHQHFMIIMEQGARLFGLRTDTAIFRWSDAAISVICCCIALIVLRRYAPGLIGEKRLNERPPGRRNAPEAEYI